MTIDFIFDSGRCYFKPFDSSNDRDPETGKTGVNYCRYQFIGAIFSLIGLTYAIHGENKGNRHTCYVYTKNLNDWLKRHEKDPSIDHNWNENPDLIIKNIKKINNLIAENYIKAITQNHQKKMDYITSCEINPGTPLSYEEVLAKAEQDFAEHENKNEILEQIKTQLKSHTYKRDLEKGIPPCFSTGGLPWNFPESKRYPIYCIARNFLRSLPGVDVTPSPPNKECPHQARFDIG